LEELKAMALAKWEEWAEVCQDPSDSRAIPLEDELGKLENRANAINSVRFERWKYGDKGYVNNIHSRGVGRFRTSQMAQEKK
jgi:hypothetical protein